ncbi:putative E3 ubiquitin-protein ligase RHY1A, partial [Castanea sativa]|uniref:putative E3 ubiquitin-protein ligase RHY1A n=1 Tax=Castanea sativa TaxID=21020 RepID=UPI003F6500D9
NEAGRFNHNSGFVYVCLCGEIKHEIQNQYLYCSSVPRGLYFFPLISTLCWLEKERPSVQPEQSTSQFVSSNRVNTENLSCTNRPRLIENEDRLPGAVLLARARLLERLRGVPLSANRGSGRPLSDRPELTLEDDLRELVDDRDLGTQASAGQSAGRSSITGLTSRIERLQLLLKPKKKPPCLSQEALDCLHLEVFSSKVGGAVSRASQDCSICLETFVEGDALIHLPCSHSFHSACLDPWLRTCGDCPYCCRTITIVTSHNKASKSYIFLLEMLCNLGFPTRESFGTDQIFFFFL